MKKSNVLLSFALLPFLLGVSSLAVSATVAETLEANKDSNFTILFPINVASAKINLNVTVPSNFKPIKQETNSKLLEFMPKTDQDPFKWTEIITLNPIIGKRVSAADYIASMQKAMMEAATNPKIIESDKHDYGQYQDAYFIMQYKNKDRDELALFYSASGPYDLANVQYAVLLNNAQDLKSALKKLKSFMQNNVEIIK